MSQENVEIVTRVVQAWNGGDVEAILALLHADRRCVSVARPWCVGVHPYAPRGPRWAVLGSNQ